jgi:hypothetical protein
LRSKQLGPALFSVPDACPFTTPAWSADGQWLYFHRRDEKLPCQVGLWQVPVKGGVAVPAPNLPDSTWIGVPSVNLVPIAPPEPVAEPVVEPVAIAPAPPEPVAIAPAPPVVEPAPPVVVTPPAAPAAELAIVLVSRDGSIVKLRAQATGLATPIAYRWELADGDDYAELTARGDQATLIFTYATPVVVRITAIAADGQQLTVLTTIE